MALNATTLSGGITANQVVITLASGTGAAVGKFLKVDSEFMKITNIDNSPQIGVQRGINGTAAVAHATTATVNIGFGYDFPYVPAPRTYTYGASGAITVAPGTHILKGPAGSVTMTLASPTGAQNGYVMKLTAATAEAYTVTCTAGFNGGSTASDVATYGAIGDSLTIEAVNGVWNVIANEGVSLG
jgi:hypothetical protein